MLNRLLLIMVSLGWFLNVSANGDDVLFTVDDTEVKVSEFEYIYNKNNFNNKADYSKESLKEYLDLYINFRLKVKQAEADGLDKDPKLLSELKVYQEQLYNSFFDKEVLQKLVDETNTRLKQDVSLSHIYTNPNNNAAAEKLIYEAYGALEKGVSFEEAAKQYSDDTYTKENGGNLGYFTALQIAFYELENAAYNNEIGSFSQPIKTSIGYHIIKVNDKRSARGKVKVAIIKLNKDKNSEQKNIQAQEKIKSIYNDLKKGADFNTQVKAYSQDLKTKEYGGELPWFGIAQYEPIFEENAFKIKEIGDISEPFETPSAWYVIKLVGKKSAEDIIAEKEEIVTEIKKSDRYKIQRLNHVENVVKNYGFTINEKVKSALDSKILTALENNNLKLDPIENPATIFTIGKDFETTDQAFQEFIVSNSFRYKNSSNQEKLDKLFSSFREKRVLDFHLVEYGNENKEYGALLREYRDGILLFDLMEKKVWSKAVQDSVGLRKFFEQNKSDFKVPEKATVKKFTAKDAKSAALLMKFLKVDSNLDNPKYIAKLEKKGVSIATEDLVVLKSDALSKQLIWKENGIKSAQDDDHYAVYQVTEIIPEKERAFNDAKGFAIAGYQEYLEKQWIDELKKKFKVTVNENVLNAMVK